MIRALKVNRDDSRVKSNTCTDGNKTFELSAGKLFNHIKNGDVENASIEYVGDKSVIKVPKNKSTGTGDCTDVDVVLASSSVIESENVSDVPKAALKNMDEVKGGLKVFRW